MDSFPGDLTDRLIGIIEAIAKGSYLQDIMELTKPGRPETIRRIAEAVGLMMVKIEAREYQLEQLVEELRELNERLINNVINTVTTMANALAARDEYTEGHATRVADYAQRIARRLGLPENEVNNIRLGGILHDIGKIGFPDALFEAHGLPLTDDLLSSIKVHPENGVNILRDLDFLGPIVDFVHYHHERFDGQGYPKGLMGWEIPLGARIISVADCFDAMTTDRPYQRGTSYAEGLEILKRISGSQLDPEVVRAFVEEISHNGVSKE
ncbi:MAG: HD-GYP domain-containing protein [Deltaproteobacteria bacterium]|nr:HD-GYP domain-containing protein [Deltaproteobacteria bacterium]